jgi:hypothetical protein
MVEVLMLHGGLGSDLRIQLLDLITLLQSSGVGSQLGRDKIRQGKMTETKNLLCA